jgi:hypothetical protein
MITILTLAIGVDYRKSLAKALNSKRLYAEKHSYTYVEGAEDWWDRTRPIAWSKIPFLMDQLQRMPEGALVWLSDADVLITNLSLKVEDHVIPFLPDDKDMLLVFDACKHLNSGNILMRNTAWTREFWRRVNERTDCTYHIWWENMAIIKLIQETPEYNEKIQYTTKHKIFNAYLMGLPDEPLWEPGDFLVHFAGIYDVNRMNYFINEIEGGRVPRKGIWD